MTKQEKLLLLIDLCARLPYGVKVKIKNIIQPQRLHWSYISDEKDWDLPKPYLRPMLSMTEEEMNELKSILPFPNGDIFINCDEVQIFDISGDKSISWHCFYDVINWLNAHHFDYRGLIPKGLALEAPENMYND